MSRFEMGEAEITELKPYSNTLEKESNLVFTKTAVIKYIEDTIATESYIGNKDKLWDQKIKSANVNFFLKKTVETTFLRTESVFDKKWKLHKVISAIYNPDFKK